MVFCGDCNVKFSKTSNLRAHVKKKHPDNLEKLAPKVKQEKSVVQCLECNKKFINFGNLRRHTKVKHPDKLNMLVPLKKIYKCKNCSEEFEAVKHLIIHRKKHQTGKKLKCVFCDYTGPHRQNIIEHYRTHHFVQIEYETLHFESTTDFQLWKSRIEKTTCSSFINRYGATKTKIIYKCHRSGEFRSRGKNNRKLKIKGSNKIGGYCPALISTVLKSNGCEVKFCKTHTGHGEQDLGHLFLSESQRQSIATKIAAKIPFQTILDEIRDSVTDCHLERLHLLTKKDLFNIEQCFKLNSASVRHSNDAISVEAWVNEMKATNTVLFYKPQETLCEDCPILKKEDFLLIIMTEGQKELLLKFGEDCICIDGTHGLNGYGFELHSILVLDDLREGYPCAFLISSRSDSEVMQIFFSCVEQRLLQKLKPKVFMSDMAESYYNAWVQVMLPAEFRLYCTWHVDRAWRKNLEKVNDKGKKIQIYQMLRVVLQETDVNAFTRLINEFMIYCKKDLDTLEFAKYFEQNYLPKVAQWAYCFRINSGLNTNMHIERMHRTIKHIYLNGKFVKRLDKAIGALMKFVRDKIFERLIIIHKGKVPTKLNDLRKRHKNSESLDLSKVMLTEEGWMVPSSSSKEIYMIEKLKSDCSCKLTCDECSSCLHQFTCTCLDASIKWNMCKHIHLVCRYLKQQPQNISTQIEAPLLEELVIDTENESSVLVSTVSSQRQEHKHFEEEKKTFLDLLFRQLNEKINTFEELEATKRLVGPIMPTLEAIKNRQLCEAITPVDIASHSRNLPANKNIIPQRRLCSIKKKVTRKKQVLLKPSSEESDTLAVKMLYRFDQ